MASQARLEVEIATTIAKVAGGLAVADFFKDTIKAASDAEQSIGGVEAVFKSNATQVKQWATESAQALGLSASSYRDLATLIGTQLKSAGTSMDDLGPQTDALIQSGADLAAMFGGTTSEAVEAISSLLKGERDPIEKYGVSINQAAINAKAMELGLGDLVKAGDQAATMQVTLALLTDKTTDAFGANAREADSAAGTQARLAASFEDSKAAIGAGLLPLFSNLAGTAKTLLNALTPLLSVVTGVVGALGKLPGPITLGIAAMGALIAKSGAIKALFSDLRNSAVSTGTAFGTFGKSLAKAGALGVVTAIGSTIASSFAKTKEAADDAKKAIDGIVDALVTSNGKMDAAFKDQQRSVIENSDNFKALTAAGVSYGDAMDLATGKTLDQATMQGILDTAMKGGQASQEAVVELLKIATTDYGTLAKQKLDYIAKTEAEKAANKAVADGMVQVTTLSKGLALGLLGIGKAKAEAAKVPFTLATDAFDQGKKDIADLGQAWLDYAKDQADAALASTVVSTALAAVSATADATKRSIQFLSIEFDKLAGRNRSVEQASADMNEAIAGIADAFKDAGKAGGISKTALVNWNVAALTSTEAGRKAFGALNNVRDAFDETVASAFEAGNAAGGAAKGISAARTAADKSRAKFVGMAKSMGLTTDEAETLADRLGILKGTDIDDKTFKAIMDDKKAKQAVDDLDKKKIKDKEAKINVGVVGDKEATRKLNQVGVPRKAEITATPKNLGPAGQQLGALAKKRQADVIAKAFTVPANAALNTVARRRTSRIDAVLAGAQSISNAIGRLTGTHTATIQGQAITGAAESELNNVARDRTANIAAEVNVSINAVSQAARDLLNRIIPGLQSLPPAPPSGPTVTPHLVAGVPTARAVAFTATPAAVAPQPTTVINVNGALDPDAVARQINRIQLSRARRIGPLQMGGTVT